MKRISMKSKDPLLETAKSLDIHIKEAELKDVLPLTVLLNDNVYQLYETRLSENDYKIEYRSIVKEGIGQKTLTFEGDDERSVVVDVLDWLLDSKVIANMNSKQWRIYGEYNLEKYLEHISQFMRLEYGFGKSTLLDLVLDKGESDALQYFRSEGNAWGLDGANFWWLFILADVELYDGEYVDFPFFNLFIQGNNYVVKAKEILEKTRSAAFIYGQICDTAWAQSLPLCEIEKIFPGFMEDYLLKEKERLDQHIDYLEEEHLEEFNKIGRRAGLKDITSTSELPLRKIDLFRALYFNIDKIKHGLYHTIDELDSIPGLILLNYILPNSYIVHFIKKEAENYRVNIFSEIPFELANRVFKYSELFTKYDLEYEDMIAYLLFYIYEDANYCTVGSDFYSGVSGLGDEVFSGKYEYEWYFKNRSRVKKLN